MRYLGKKICFSVVMSVVLIGCSSDTGQPTPAMIKEFQKTLGIGSYIFNVQSMYNGSQSVETRPSIFRVVDIKGDYVFAQPVYPVDHGISMTDYQKLVENVNSEDIEPIVIPNEEQYSDGFKEEKLALVKLRNEKPATNYAHRCNVFYLKVFSASAIVNDGTLEYYSHDWSPTLVLKNFGYIAKLIQPEHVPSNICPDYGHMWLPDSLQNLPIP